MVWKVELCLRKWDPWWGIDGHEEVVDVFEGVQVPWMYRKQNPIRSQFQCRQLTIIYAKNWKLSLGVQQKWSVFKDVRKMDIFLL